MPPLEWKQDDVSTLPTTWQRTWEEKKGDLQSSGAQEGLREGQTQMCRACKHCLVRWSYIVSMQPI